MGLHSERFLFPETEVSFFPVVAAGAAHILPERALESLSQPFLGHVTGD